MTRDEAARVRKLLRGSRMMLDVDKIQSKALPWFGATLFCGGLVMGWSTDAPPLLRFLVSALSIGCAAWQIRLTFTLRERLRAFKAEEDEQEAEDTEPAPYRAVLTLNDEDGTQHHFDTPEAMVDFVVARAVAAGEVPPELAQELTESGLRQLRHALEQEAMPPPMCRRH